MNKALFTSIFMVFLCTGSLMAQQRSIKGKVLEYATQEPVIGATIVGSGTQSGTTTDAQGAFSLLLPGQRHFRCLMWAMSRRPCR